MPRDNTEIETDIKDMLQKILEAVEKKPKKQTGGCVTSREKVETVWSDLLKSAGKTPADIAEATGLYKSTVQRALYILLAENRSRREKLDNSWHYFQTGEPSVEPTGPKKCFDIETLVEVVPFGRDNALTVLELSKLITANPGTIRSKLKILEASGRIRSVPSINRQHQPVTKYYRD
jgi:hypothetical protein